MKAAGGRLAQIGLRSRLLPFAALLLATAFFRATQNAVQTTIGPFGHILLKLSPAIVGFGITLTGTVSALAYWWLARRLESVRLRRMALVGLVGTSLTILVVVVGSSLPTYLMSAVIFGAAGGLVMTALATLAGQVPGVAKGRSISAFTVALSASLALGPIAESLVLRVSGGSLKVAMLAFLPLPLVGAGLLVFVVSQVKPLTESEHADAFPAHIRDNPHLRKAIVALLLYQIPFVAITSFGALIGHFSYGVSASLAQLSFSVFFAMSLGARLLLVWKPPGKRGGLLLRIVAFVTLAGIIVLGLGHSYIWLLIAMAILGIPHGLVFPVSLSLVASSSSSADLPKANAVLFAATGVAAVVTPLVFGVIATYLGYRVMSLLTLIPVLVLTVILLRSDASKA